MIFIFSIFITVNIAVGGCGAVAVVVVDVVVALSKKGKTVLDQIFTCWLDGGLIEENK